MLTVPEAARKCARLAQVLQRDAHDRGNGYTVRSLYFDTPYDKDFADKTDGLLSRRKIRLRTYGNGGEEGHGQPLIRLECKEKTTSFQRKRAVVLDRAQALRLMAGDYGVLTEKDDALCDELYGLMTKLSYRPNCIVAYERTAFAEDFNDTRVTFDRNVRMCATNADLFAENLFYLPATRPDTVTMEVKFSHFLPSYVKKAVGLTDSAQVSASKYEMSRLAL